MIIDAIFGLVFGFFEFVLDLLPAWTDPELFGSSETCELSGSSPCDLYYLTHGFGQKAAGLYDWLPVTLVIQVLGLMLTITIAVSAAKLALFVYERFPFKSS